MSIQRLQQVKDLFIFSCYTGLSYTDLIHLTSENLVRGIDGQLWIESSRQKTDQAIKVPLLSQALEILNRYEDHPKALAYGRLFPPISNQRMNRGGGPLLSQGNRRYVRNYQKSDVSHCATYFRHYGYTDQWCAYRIGISHAWPQYHSYHADLRQSR